jgi:AcrR family transcriptional regulator
MTTMAKSERARLLDAMLEEMAEKGYRGVEVEEAMRRAGIADVTTAAEFDDKDACLYAAYAHHAKRLLESATGQCDSREEWPERVRHALASLLDTLAAQPELTKVVVRTFPAIRPDAYAQYLSLLETFAPFLEEGRAFSEVGSQLPNQVEMLAVGAAEAIIFDEIMAGRTAKLPALMPSILFSVLVPFLGPDKASAAMQSAAQAA